MEDQRISGRKGISDRNRDIREERKVKEERRGKRKGSKGKGKREKKGVVG